MDREHYDFIRSLDGSPEVATLKARLDSDQRFDAAIDTGLIARQLIYVKKTIYETKYAELKARTLIPVANDTPAGAESISTLMWNGTGVAKIITGAAQDIPRADASVNEQLSPVEELAIMYGYTVRDLERAAFTGAPLDVQKARRARRGAEQALDIIAAVGEAQTGLSGLLNNANVPIDAATGNWSGLTPAQILADMARMTANMISATDDVEHPDTMVLPTTDFVQISQTQYSTLNGQSILSVYLANNPYIKNVETWTRLNTAGVGGVARAMVYRRDPEVLTLEIPLEYTELPPQLKGLEYQIIGRMLTGGVTVRYPLAIRFLDGV